MRERLAEYSAILQLDTATMLRFKYAADGLVRALQMYFMISLAIGLGVLFGIPVLIDRPVLYEVLNDAQAIVSEISGSVEPYLEANIPFLPAPEKIAEPLGDAANTAADVVNELLEMAQTESELVSPPLGVRASRIIRLTGRWLSVPFDIMANWLFLFLTAMLIAKILGGRATLSQHLTAVLLASAPLIFILPTYIPDLSRIVPITFALGITLLSRIIALVGFGWAALILVKGLALTHEFSWWRAAAVLLLSWLTVNVLIPLAGVLFGGYLLRG